MSGVRAFTGAVTRAARSVLAPASLFTTDVAPADLPPVGLRRHHPDVAPGIARRADDPRVAAPW
ncbi:hypothetical protein [Kitasatospora sp. Root187]|uniref:hypothetical protein n=1 Tax=Kitasatospora sp. Root187 TaxID=1736486 RepID=UPI0012FAF152|nr:hypothetical protein [Kitasatospora sp. Root187]